MSSKKARQVRHMNKKLLNVLLVFLGVFAGYSGVLNNHNATIANDKDSNKVSESNKDQLQQIVNNKDWKELCKIWKKFSHLQSQKDYNKNYYMFEELEKEKDKFSSHLTNLLNSKLINQKEHDYLLNTFIERSGYLRFHMGLVKCYKMSLIGSKIAQTRGELEQRYDIIEKLFSEGKINSETFNNTRKQIFEEMQFIDDNSHETPELKGNNRLYNLIIYLNK